MKSKFKFLFFILLPFVAFSQNSIKGTVSDESGVLLPGASVMIKGTTNGVMTDIDGNFSLNLKSEQNTIIVSFMGYKTKTVDVSNRNKEKIKIILVSEVEQLGEVVLVGYGEVKKKDVTGSVISLKLSDSNVNQAQGVENLIQGRAAGVVVTSQGFDPTSPISVQIRGVNSLTSNTQPLYVVDGIVMGSATEGAADPLSGGSSYLAPQNAMGGINPRDIESIQILKDASSTAIYGSRGSNGVILITTKKGKAGVTKFSYNVTTKAGNVARNIDVLGHTDYATYQNETRQLNGLPPNFIVDPNGKVSDLTGAELKGINWSDDVYKTSLSYNHRLTISGGGSEANNYYMAAGYVSAEGVVPNAYSKQTDFSLNLNNKLTNNLKLATKIAITSGKNSSSKGTENLGGTNNSMVRQIISAAPFAGYTLNYYGAPTDDIDDIVDGPNAWIKDYDDNSEELRGLGSLNLEYTISKVFKYRLLVGLDYRKVNRQIWYGTSIQRGAQANGEAGLTVMDRFRYNVDNTLMFNKRFNSNHKIDGTVGVIVDESNMKQISYQASNFPLKDLRADGITTGQVFQALNYNVIPESLLSFLGRFNYTFKEKFNFTATVRSDGSSKFASGNQFSTFPAFAFAWQIHREKFMDGFTKLNEAKLRLSWGLTGNQGIRPYQTITPYGPTANPYFNSTGAGITALVPTTLANPNLIWETTSQFNTGIDLSFFNKRLTTTIDVYYKETSDLLQYLNIGPSSGYKNITANQGDLINKGAEFTISADIIKSKNFLWNVYGNISKYKNEIANLGLPPAEFGSNTYSAFLGNQVSAGNTFKTPANIFIEGKESGLFWGYQTDGIINNSEELALASTFGGIAPRLGDVNLVDQNGDKIIDAKDKTIIGNPNPDFTYGFGSNVEYKGLSLNIFFNGVTGNDVANGNLLREDYATGNPDNIRPRAYNNAWTATNTEGTYPRTGYSNTLVEGTGFTDRIVEDGSFLRLTNVTLGYRIPIEIKAINSMDLSFSAYNLLLFTDYSGYDPEVNSFAFDPLRTGLDWQSFPNQKSFSLALNVSF
ncbi:SusC/RagA family TonB-linked outer membrane protein [Flavobacterium nackdongense]|uniref:TonB-dependent receptor n=1 Tax=Flavobacterium nackdongense TaxID=2547394 RepID=A0A4P6YHM4_9FLAO|nr:TonB-dependent receptor [Flavobacterium nackdongense]QBN20444.1 TonB-dependent receptor [Flavobacterium nackdongense]